MIDPITIEAPPTLPCRHSSRLDWTDRGAAGLATALDYVEGVGRFAISEHELIRRMVERLAELPGTISWATLG